MYSVGIRAALGKVCALDAVCRVVEQVGFLGKHPPLLTVVLLHTPSLVTKPMCGGIGDKAEASSPHASIEVVVRNLSKNTSAAPFGVLVAI